MSNTYTQIHIHLIFAVQNRESQIKTEWKDRLYQYIISIIQGEGHKVLSINGVTDHIHVLFGMRPNQALSDLVKKIKANSSKWVNSNHLSFGRFNWQEGYGAFSCSKSKLKEVIDYISKQEEHHEKINLTCEYETFLKKYEVDYDPKYIFHEIE